MNALCEELHSWHRVLSMLPLLSRLRTAHSATAAPKTRVFPEGDRGVLVSRDITCLTSSKTPAPFANRTKMPSMRTQSTTGKRARACKARPRMQRSRASLRSIGDLRTKAERRQHLDRGMISPFACVTACPCSRLYPAALPLSLATSRVQPHRRAVPTLRHVRWQYLWPAHHIPAEPGARNG